MLATDTDTVRDMGTELVADTDMDKAVADMDTGLALDNHHCRPDKSESGTTASDTGRTDTKGRVRAGILV